MLTARPVPLPFWPAFCSVLGLVISSLPFSDFETCRDGRQIDPRYTQSSAKCHRITPWPHHLISQV